MSIPVTERALLGRINRKLAHDGQKLYRTRLGTRAEHEFGNYYIVDTFTSAVHAHHCDLADVGRELGVLKDWEALVDEDQAATG